MPKFSSLEFLCDSARFRSHRTRGRERFEKLPRALGVEAWKLGYSLLARVADSLHASEFFEQHAPLYRSVPPSRDEFSADEEPLAWDAEGWEGGG